MTKALGQGHGLNRRALLRSVLIAGAGTASVGAISSSLAVPARAASSQANWGWCTKCSGLFWATASFKSNGVCTAGGSHNLGGTNYSLVNGASTSGNPADPNSFGLQAGWSWCNLCQGLFWHNNPGTCPNNFSVLTGWGGHAAGSSTNYDVYFGYAVTSSLQGGWDYCSSCGGFYWGNGWGMDAGNCPAYPISNHSHSHGSSTKYEVAHS
jgi:hypothetical protein